MSQNNLSKKIITPGQIILVIISLLLVIFALYGNWVFLHKLCPEDRGTLGDMFGVVNAVFTGLAFVGVVLTVILQRNDLKIQKEERIAAEDELKEQKAVLVIQRFETTFFNMLNLQNEIVKNISYNGHQGRRVFDEAYKKLLVLLDAKNAEKTLKMTVNDTHSIPQIPKDLDSANESIQSHYFDGYYNDFTSAFNHYFRHLYHIFKFIYFSDLSLNDKLFYATLCRAQLSQNELLALSFNILIDGYGKPNFLYLVREYKVLENFDHSTIQPHLYWDLINREINNVSYPFDNRPKPKERVIN